MIIDSNVIVYNPRVYLINMTRRKIPSEIVGEIRAFLRNNWSYSMIIKELKQRNISVSKGAISKIANPENQENRPKKNKVMGRPPKLTKKDLKVLDELTNRINPPSQRDLAARFNITQKYAYLPIF